MNQELLIKMQNYAKKMSVNELKNIKAERLMDILESDKNVMKSFAAELHNEGILSYKYDFKCPNCNKDCTAYERVLKKEEYYCGKCGQLVPDEVIGKKSWMIYSINKNELLNYQMDTDVDFVEGTIGKRIVLDLNGKINNIKNEEEKVMKIFIGSSKEAEDEMERIGVMIEKLNCDVITWQDEEAFVAGDFTLESLINLSKKVDAAIFVFNGDDETWYRNTLVKSIRDNVMFEYGLFIGAKGRKNVTFMCKNKPKIATDLLGLNYINGEDKDLSLKKNIKVWLNSLTNN